jgi:hypothetical protein
MFFVGDRLLSLGPVFRIRDILGSGCGSVLPSNGDGFGCHPYQNLQCPLECKKIYFVIFLMFKKNIPGTDPDPEHCLRP